MTLDYPFISSLLLSRATATDAFSTWLSGDRTTIYQKATRLTRNDDFSFSILTSVKNKALDHAFHQKYSPKQFPPESFSYPFVCINPEGSLKMTQKHVKDQISLSCIMLCIFMVLYLASSSSMSLYKPKIILWVPKLLSPSTLILT